MNANPCETHRNVKALDGYCPICLIEERDRLRAENAALVTEKGNAWYDSLSMGMRIAELEAERDRIRAALKELGRYYLSHVLPAQVVEAIRDALEESETK